MAISKQWRTFATELTNKRFTTMAGIDKLYLNNYFDYDELRRWAIVYYPELLFYFYSVCENYTDWSESISEYVKDHKEIAERDYKLLGDFKTKDEAIKNLIDHYKSSADYDCPLEQAIDEVDSIIEAYNRTDEDWENVYSHPVTNTPFSVDKKLKWICPLPFVRKYLHEQCGVNPKYEWFYRLFWRGKKHF